MRPDSSRPRALLFLAALAGLYFLAGKLGLAVAIVHANASSVWPPTGIALAAGLLYGLRVWPAVLVGAFLVNVTTDIPVGSAAGIAVGNTLETVTGAWLAIRYAGGAAAFDRPQGVFRFALLAAGVATLVGATIGTASLWAGGSADPQRLGDIWLTWWLGDAVGALVFAPFIVLWTRRPEALPRRRWFEAGTLAVTIVVTGWVVFQYLAPVAFLCVPPLLWAAFRFGPRGAMTAAVALSTIALWGTLQGVGPFGGLSPEESLLFLQAFFGVTTLTALVLAADIRERQRAEAALRRMGGELEARVEERTASLQEALEQLGRSRAVLAEAQALAHIGSWEWDVAADRVTWSDELHHIYGLAPGSIQVDYRAYLERVHPADRETVESAIDQALESGGAFEFEERIVRPAGEVRVLLSQGRVERDAGGLPVRMVGTCHDITERKQAELELARRMEDLTRSHAELSMLTHAASHDLKEPLRTVASNVQLIERSLRANRDPAILRSVEFAVAGVRRMDELIQDLLEYSGADRAAPRETEAGQALTEALEVLASIVEESGARVDSGPLPRVQADPLRLVRLFQNLLSNAIKYRHPDRPPLIRISAEREDGVWRFDLADNGLGVGPADAELIFLPFERLHRVLDRPGTGLGLAICRRIVEAHGGRIWTEPSADGGSVFRFTLPAGPGG